MWWMEVARNNEVRLSWAADLFRPWDALTHSYISIESINLTVGHTFPATHNILSLRVHMVPWRTLCSSGVQYSSLSGFCPGIGEVERRLGFPHRGDRDRCFMAPRWNSHLHLRQWSVKISQSLWAWNNLAGEIRQLNWPALALMGVSWTCRLGYVQCSSAFFCPVLLIGSQEASPQPCLGLCCGLRAGPSALPPYIPPCQIQQSNSCFLFPCGAAPSHLSSPSLNLCCPICVSGHLSMDLILSPLPEALWIHLSCPRISSSPLCSLRYFLPINLYVTHCHALHGSTAVFRWVIVLKWESWKYFLYYRGLQSFKLRVYHLHLFCLI